MTDSANAAGVVRIRNAVTADVAALAELGERTFRDTYAAHNRPEDMDALVAARYHPDEVARELAADRSHFLVAEVAGAPVGFALLRDVPPDKDVRLPDGRALQMDQLYVAHHSHGRGVGSALMEQCRRVARDNGYDLMWLSVWEHNRRAITFYHRHGFAEAGELTFRLGDDVQRDLLLVLRL
jgi:diamine N-acetyltransferase